MVRIPSDEIERLKREISLEHLVRAHGVELKARGEDLVARCPFGTHDDETPSFVVTPGKNVFHCFGCSVGGSVIDWVMRTRSVSFRNAVELLREKGSAATSGDLPQMHAGKLPPVVTSEMTDAQMMDAVTSFYSAAYWKTLEAQQYAAQRLIGDEAIARKHRYGFSDRTLGYRLPAAPTKEGKLVRERLTSLGILRDTGHEAMRGRLIIPLLDDIGQVVGMYGRLTTPAQRDTPVHMYLKGPHRGVFNLEGIRGQGQVILCEAIIDALTFISVGITNVTTAYGVEGFTDEILETLKNNGTRLVIIAFDRDDAGDAGAERAAEKLVAAGMECVRAKLPHQMDVNEYARKVKPAQQSLRLVVQGAAWLAKGLSATQTTTTLEEPRTITTTPTPAVEEPRAMTTTPTPAVEEARAMTTTTAVVEEPRTIAAPSTPASALPPLEEIRPTARTTNPDDVKLDELIVERGPRRYRVQGWQKNASPLVLKVTLSVRTGEAFHKDTLDLNVARGRLHFIKTAAAELAIQEDVIKKDVGEILGKLEDLQEARLKELLTPKPAAPVMSDDERREAEDFLKDPRMLERIVKDFERIGIVGEENNKLVSYLAATSRKLHKPLAIVLRSTSGAGKSSLMDAVLSFMPDEEVVQYSAMTGQALYYMGETSLRHKILALAEEEGAERAAYALKLLQSEGRLAIASTGKDPQTGELTTKDYRVEGPVMVFQTTTRDDTDEELLNRCIVLTADESVEQTRAIHAQQRRSVTLEGIMGQSVKALIQRAHRNAQRLLKALPVRNPYADILVFPQHKLRFRRDHPKYLALIEAVALLHQYQRHRGEAVTAYGEVIEYLDITVDDIATANKLAAEAFGQSLDELPAQTRRFLLLLQDKVREECQRRGLERHLLHFSARWVREATQLGSTQVKTHLARLVGEELVLVHRAPRGQGVAYELDWDGSGVDGSAFISGVTPTEILREYDVQRSAQSEQRSGHGRAEVGPVSGGGRAPLNGKTAHKDAAIFANARADGKTTVPGGGEE